MMESVVSGMSQALIYSCRLAVNWPRHKRIASHSAPTPATASRPRAEARDPGRPTPAFDRRG